MSAPHTDQADDRREREANAIRRTPERRIPDLSGWFGDGPRPLPTPATCSRCGEPTPDLAARMAHDESCGTVHGQDQM